MTAPQKPQDDLSVLLDALLAELMGMSDEQVLDGEGPATVQARGLTLLSAAKQKAAGEYPQEYTSPGFIPHRWVIAAILEAGKQSAMFRDVKAMNDAFGNPEGDTANLDRKRMLNQCVNIGSEFVELMAAFGVKADIKLTVLDDQAFSVDDVRDALCDINVFSLGAHHLMGFDADRDMEEVVAAVMTRFCKDGETFEATCKKYDDAGVKYTVHGEYPRVYLKSAEDQQMPEYPKGKFLKAVGYRKPVFYHPAPKRDRIAEMARQREEHKRRQAEMKRIRDAKILEFTNALLIADGEEPLTGPAPWRPCKGP